MRMHQSLGSLGHRVGRSALVGLTIAAVPLASACSSSGTPHALPSPSASTSSVAAVRWWSNSGTTAGSAISASNPLAVARTLHPSRTDYCGMLRQTVAAGKTILPGVTATDPALLTSTKAFIGELQHVAPASVAQPWQTLGSAVIALVTSGGGTTGVKGADAAAVQKASSAIASDAKHSCGIELSTNPAG